MKILQVSATDFGGGAAKVAWDLHKAYQQRGYDSWIAVGKKKTADSCVMQIPNEKPQNTWEQATFALANQTKKLIGKIKGAGAATIFFNAAARYRNTVDYFYGRELFNYPGSNHLLSLPSHIPDLIHCHNLHSKYFDLRLLPQFSHQLPTILTLHDTWLLSGHCAYAKTCNRWQTGCGECPDLKLYPAIRRDNTAFNWRLKKDLYAQSVLYVTTPCKWLMNKVSSSMLQPGIKKQRVIHNGVDIDFFRPGDKSAARVALNFDPQEFIVLFVANSVRNNIWKDFSTLKKGMEILSAQRPAAKVRLVCFGDESPLEYAGDIPISFIPHTADLARLVKFYQAADVYVHAAKADTFPTVVLEALACGLPVIATALDGISEQIKSLQGLKTLEPFMEPLEVFSSSDATGVGVSRNGADEIAYWLSSFIDNPALRAKLALNARRDAMQRFDFNKQVANYLEWYVECIEDFKTLKKTEKEKESSHLYE